MYQNAHLLSLLIKINNMLVCPNHSVYKIVMGYHTSNLILSIQKCIHIVWVPVGIQNKVNNFIMRLIQESTKLSSVFRRVKELVLICIVTQLILVYLIKTICICRITHILRPLIHKLLSKPQYVMAIVQHLPHS